MKKKSNALFISLVLFLFGGYPAINSYIAAQEMDLKNRELKEMLYSDALQQSTFFGYLSPEYKLIFDMGESALPVLHQVLEDEDYKKQSFIIDCIKLIGGEKAKKILQDISKRTDKRAVKIALCQIMSTTGTEEDKAFIIETVKTADHWSQAYSALFSLWALDPKGTVEIFGNEEAEDIPKNIARYVNNEMRGRGGAGTPQAVDAIERDQVILSLFRHGIIGINRGKSFAETEVKRTWKFEDNSWIFTTENFRPPVKTSQISLIIDPPSIEFIIHITPDKTRAMTIVAISYGSLMSSSNLYILNHIYNEWKVVSVIQVGVS